MAMADKCHLNIPFKEYLKGLRLDGEGKLSQSQLDRAASQEFENYKAIERRINDRGCAGGGCCTWGFNGRGGGSVASSGDSTIEVSAGNSSLGGYLYPSETNEVSLPAGVWMVSGYVSVQLAGAGTGYLTAGYRPSSISYGSFDAERGGSVDGMGVANGASEFTFPIAGTVLDNGVWSPTITIINQTDEDATIEIFYNALGSCACQLSATNQSS